MSRSLITLAACAACAATPAFAQSTGSPASGMQLFGVLDSGILSISNTSTSPLGYVPSTAPGARFTGAKDGGIGGSYWGMRGREDLGGGYVAQFALQGNIVSNTGVTGGPNSTAGTSFFNQLATVGLSGPFGSVAAGRLISPMYYAMASTDGRTARYFGSVLTALVGLNSASGSFAGNNSNPAFGTVYNDNAVVWTSPNWYHIVVNAEYAFGNTAGSTKANSQQALTAVYDNGGLRLSALYYNGYGNNLGIATSLFTVATGSAAAGAAAAANAGFSPTANTNRLASLGALYTTGVWTVATSYFQARNPAHAIVPGGSDALDMWQVSGGVRPSAAWNFTAGYYKITDKLNSGNHAAQFAIGAEYSLSKRTLVYAEGAAIQNKGRNMNLSPIYGTPVQANADTHAVMVGLRHSF